MARIAFRSGVAALALALGACGDGATHGVGNKAPNAVAGPDVATLAGMTVRLDGGDSSDPDGEIVAWRWAFGDGEAAQGAVATHVYAAPGTYTAVLTVTDDLGATDTDELSVVVTKANAPPIAEIAGPSRVETNADFTVSASGSTDTDGQIVKYEWDFGDGSTDGRVSATHRYTTAGARTIRLTVTDDDGDTDTATLDVLAVVPEVTVPATSQWSWALKPGQSGPGGLCTFGTGALTVNISGTGATTRPCTVNENAGLGGTVTYTGTYTVATRAFDVTNTETFGGTGTIRATFNAAFTTFEGSYTHAGGGCNYTVQVQGTRQ